MSLNELFSAFTVGFCAGIFFKITADIIFYAINSLVAVIRNTLKP